MSEELECLRHALGLNDDGTGKSWRNYFCADPADETCVALVASGDMRVGRDVPSGIALKYFHVTDEGKARALPDEIKYRKKKSTRVMTYDQWDHGHECGDLCVDRFGKLYRLYESSGRRKSCAGELSAREIDPPGIGFKAVIRDGEIYWVKGVVPNV